MSKFIKRYLLNGDYELILNPNHNSLIDKIKEPRQKAKTSYSWHKLQKYGCNKVYGMKEVKPKKKRVNTRATVFERLKNDFN